GSLSCTLRATATDAGTSRLPAPKSPVGSLCCMASILPESSSHQGATPARFTSCQATRSLNKRQVRSEYKTSTICTVALCLMRSSQLKQSRIHSLNQVRPPLLVG